MNEEIVREITVLNEALENAEAEIGRLRAALRATREPGAPAHRIFAELRAEALRLKTLWEECEKDNKDLEDNSAWLRERAERLEEERDDLARLFTERDLEVFRLAAIRDELEAEVEKLRRDNDLLREALRNG